MFSIALAAVLLVIASGEAVRKNEILVRRVVKCFVVIILSVGGASSAVAVNPYLSPLPYLGSFQTLDEMNVGDEKPGVQKDAAPADATRTTLAVKGMTCSSCEQAIKSALEKIPGVSLVEADSVAGSVSFSTSDKDASDKDGAILKVKEAIKGLGYTVE